MPSTGLLSRPIGVVYSNPFQNKSIFVHVDNNQMNSHEIDAPGIWRLEHHGKEQDEIWLWSDRYRNLYRVDHHNIKVTSVEKLAYPPIMFKDDQDLLIKGMNASIEKNIVEYHHGGKTQMLEFPSLVTQAIHVNSHLYLFSDIVEQERSCLYIVDIEAGKTVKTIPLQEKSAYDMAFFENHIVLSTKNRLTV